MENDPEYKAYRKVRKVRPVVRKLLAKTGLDLSGEGGIPELIKFLEHFREYKITVYLGLACNDKCSKARSTPLEELIYSTMMSNSTIM